MLNTFIIASAFAITSPYWLGVAKAHEWYPADCCYGGDCRPVFAVTPFPADFFPQIRHPAIGPWLGRSNTIRSVEAPRLHHSARRRGGRVAARGTRAAAGDAGDRISNRRFA